MDARSLVNQIPRDTERRRAEAWRDLHRRPDAPPLPPEVEVPWTDRFVAVRWLARAWAAIRRTPAAPPRVRAGEEATSR